jgi:hypothetical protein
MLVIGELDVPLLIYPQVVDYKILKTKLTPKHLAIRLPESQAVWLIVCIQ